jgi:hypothetical protein
MQCRTRWLAFLAAPGYRWATNVRWTEQARLVHPVSNSTQTRSQNSKDDQNTGQKRQYGSMYCINICMVCLVQNLLPHRFTDRVGLRCDLESLACCRTRRRESVASHRSMFECRLYDRVLVCFESSTRVVVVHPPLLWHSLDEWNSLLADSGRDRPAAGVQVR